MKKFSFIFALIFLFSSCAPVTTVVVPPTLPSTATIIPTSTNTPTPQPTLTPTLTPTPTLIPRTPITAANAKDIQLLHQISGLSGLDIAWSPDGKKLALARDYEIVLFDSETLQILSSIPTDYSFHMTILTSSHVKFSYDGTRILIGGLENRIGSGQVFDVDSGQEISEFKTLDEVTDFCAPRKILASYQMKPNLEYFCLSPERVNSLYNTTLASSPNETYRAIAVGWIFYLSQLDNKGIWQRSWDSYPSYDYPWGDSARSADFSPEGKTLAVGFQGGDIRFYETLSGVENYSLVAGYEITGLAFNPDGTRLAYSSLSGSGIIDLRSGYKITEFGGTSPGSISDIEFSPDGRWLVTSNQAGNIMLWSTQSGELVHLWYPELKIKPHKIAGGPFCQSWAGHFAFSPDGNRLALTRNGTLQLVELSNLQVVYDRRVEESTRVTFSPDGKYLATGTSFSVGGKDTLPQLDFVQVFDIANGVGLYKLRGIPSARWGQPKDWHYNCIVDMAFTPDSRILAIAAVESIRFWDMQSGEQIWQDFDPKMNELQDIEISADGSMLAAINRDGRAKIFPFKDGQISQYTIQDWGNLRWGHLAFSPDSNMIGFAYYRDGSILFELWEITDKSKRFSNVVKDSSSLSNYRLDLSSDGGLLALGGQDGVISIYGLKP